MRLPLRVTPEAEIDIFEATLWYEGERQQLGIEFLRALREVLSRIDQFPMRFPVVSAGVRRALLPRFPFGVFFVVEGEGSTVVAVMHLHRDPSQWARRR